MPFPAVVDFLFCNDFLRRSSQGQSSTSTAKIVRWHPRAFQNGGTHQQCHPRGMILPRAPLESSQPETQMFLQVTGPMAFHETLPFRSSPHQHSPHPSSSRGAPTSFLSSCSLFNASDIRNASLSLPAWSSHRADGGSCPCSEVMSTLSMKPVLATGQGWLRAGPLHATLMHTCPVSRLHPQPWALCGSASHPRPCCLLPITFCLYGFAYSRDFIYTESYNFW